VGLINQNPDGKNAVNLAFLGGAKVFTNDAANGLCVKAANLLREHWHVRSVYEANPIATGFGGLPS
jgi:hypothetical protein